MKQKRVPRFPLSVYLGVVTVPLVFAASFCVLADMLPKIIRVEPLTAGSIALISLAAMSWFHHIEHCADYEAVERIRSTNYAIKTFVTAAKKVGK